MEVVMYGLVNKAIKDLIVENFTIQAWDAVCEKANVANTDFVSMQTYPDSVTYSLVSAASDVLKMPPDAILYEFGKYWILYTAKEGYGDLMNLFGTDLKTCLINLNSMHARMGMSMPELTAPRFVVTEKSKDVFFVEYHSKRPGLCPMVKGLLEGLVEKFNENAKVDYTENSDGKANKIFKIQLLESKLR